MLKALEGSKLAIFYPEFVAWDQRTGFSLNPRALRGTNCIFLKWCWQSYANSLQELLPHKGCVCCWCFTAHLLLLWGISRFSHSEESSSEVFCTFLLWQPQHLTRPLANNLSNHSFIKTRGNNLCQIISVERTGVRVTLWSRALCSQVRLWEP